MMKRIHLIISQYFEMIQHIEKPWGYEELLEQNSSYMVKKLFMKKGHQCSFQYHEKKRETIYCLQGRLRIIGEGQIKVLKPGEFVTLPPLEKHRMRAEEEDCLYLECSTPEINDVVRIADDYGRI